MALYVTPPPDVRSVNRTSSLGMRLGPSVRLDSKLPSDVTLASRGVTFTSFEPFPIIKAGELWPTKRGEIVIVKTKVTTRDGTQEREVATVDTGTARLVIAPTETEADKKAARQAVEETTVESAPDTVAPEEIQPVAVAPETQKQTEVVQTNQSNVVAVVEPSGEVYGGVDPNQPSQSDYLQAQAEARAAETEARKAGTVITAPGGNTYNSPSQAARTELSYGQPQPQPYRPGGGTLNNQPPPAQKLASGGNRPANAGPRPSDYDEWLLMNGGY